MSKSRQQASSAKNRHRSPELSLTTPAAAGFGVHFRNMALRHVGRGLRANPGFTAVVGLTLALGIGANTAIFSLVDAVLLRPLPYPNPQELVSVKVDLVGLNLTNVGMGVPEMEDLRDQSGVFAEISAVRPISANLTGSDRPQRIEALGVSPNYFALLRANA